MSKYICVKAWARNKEGDVIDEFTFKRYPVELRDKCFKLIVEPNVPVKPLEQSKPIPVAPVSIPEPPAVTRIEEDVQLVVTGGDVESEPEIESEHPQRSFEKRFKKNL